MKEIVELLNAIYPLPEALKALLIDMVQMLLVKKGDILVNYGERCNKLFFIQKGMLCTYRKEEEDPKPYCDWFMLEKDIATAVRSYYLQEPSLERIIALEDSICWFITRQQLDHLCELFPIFRIHRQILTEKYYVQSREMECKLRRRSPEAIYDYLEKSHPELLRRAPNKEFASFMGISETTLYEIKKAKRKKK
jgi:CRP-like cAMP-binding protein